MQHRILTAALAGLEAELVTVEADVSPGLPNFTIVGLPDPSVQEARERVRSAIRRSDLPFPRGRVTVNLAPAGLRKEGGGFDLPIALAVLSASGCLSVEAFEEALVVGELSLDGGIRPASGVLSIAILAAKLGLRQFFVPEANAAEATLVPGLAVLPAKNLLALVRHLTSESRLETYQPSEDPPAVVAASLDFSLIHGQENAKRALEIAAAGGHNVLFTGPPGTGKTMLARAFPSILPGMTRQEAIEVTRIYSVSGLLPAVGGLMTTRPFRNPHHNASAPAVVGGGTNPRPGEVTLAHRGVLYLDELPEFSRSVLESLRQPLEDGGITVSRASGAARFPAKFMLLASQNPCPCGYFGDLHRPCICQPGQIIKYGKRISGPLKDRIDLHVSVPAVSLHELKGPDGELSSAVRARVEAARRVQAGRFAHHDLITNSEMGPKELKVFCQLGGEAERLIDRAVESFHLSARAYHRLFKVSRTIADLVSSDDIRPEHVAEAVQYRESQPVLT